MRNKKRKNPFLEVSSHLKITPFSSQELVVDKANIKEIEENDLSYYPNLQALYIPGNEITTLNHLEKNIRLTMIDARNNQISDLDLSRQAFLTELYLAGNKLSDLETTLSKIIHLKNLEVLDLRGNPLTLEKGYRQSVVAAMPWIKILDGLKVSSADKKKLLVSRGVKVTQRKRPQSILQVLVERPMSAADAIVKKKAKMIRAQTQMKREREEQARTAVARKRAEEFEMLAQAKEVPMPEALDFMGMKNKKQEKPEPSSEPKRRAKSRMWMKRPVYTTPKTLTIDEERAQKLNPDLPSIYRHMESEKTFPK